jgi:hypothetical protein
MLYSYNKTLLEFKKIGLRKLILILSGFTFVIGSVFYGVGRYGAFGDLTEYEKNILLLNIKETPFNEKHLIEMMKDLNMKFPHIALAQSYVETGQFKSKIFRENNNLFGMKQARQRVNTAKGTQNNHAYYDSWEESVYDYAFYQCRYLGGIHTEEEYFRYLNASYAEDPNYVSKVKSVIEKQKLRELF